MSDHSLLKILPIIIKWWAMTEQALPLIARFHKITRLIRISMTNYVCKHREQFKSLHQAVQQKWNLDVCIA